MTFFVVAGVPVTVVSGEWRIRGAFLLVDISSLAVSAVAAARRSDRVDFSRSRHPAEDRGQHPARAFPHLERMLMPELACHRGLTHDDRSTRATRAHAREESRK